jgi:hypothetical protein
MINREIQELADALKSAYLEIERLRGVIRERDAEDRKATIAELTDTEEEARSKTLAEQCWLAPLCLLVWVLVFGLLIHGCTAQGAECTLAWDAQAGVTDYRVWRGLECLATVTTNSATVTLPDEPCSLTVTARNAVGESAHSAPLSIVAVTMQESNDLKAWGSVKTVHREKQAMKFYRLRIQTP